MCIRDAPRLVCVCVTVALCPHNYAISAKRNVHLWPVAMANSIYRCPRICDGKELYLLNKPMAAGVYVRLSVGTLPRLLCAVFHLMLPDKLVSGALRQTIPRVSACVCDNKQQQISQRQQTELMNNIAIRM